MAILSDGEPRHFESIEDAFRLFCHERRCIIEECRVAVGMLLLLRRSGVPPGTEQREHWYRETRRHLVQLRLWAIGIDQGTLVQLEAMYFGSGALFHGPRVAWEALHDARKAAFKTEAARSLQRRAPQQARALGLDLEKELQEAEEALRDVGVGLGAKVRVPSDTEWRETPLSEPIRHLENWRLLGDFAAHLYALIAPRIPAERRSLRWDVGQVPATFNTRALRLVAVYLNRRFHRAFRRPLTASDIKSRVQVRKPESRFWHQFSSRYSDPAP